VPEATAAVLERLVALWGLAALTREAGDFLEDGYLSGEQVGGLGAGGQGRAWYSCCVVHLVDRHGSARRMP
jgi:hypothetical protein